jgi:hypothetical protein
MSTHFPTPPEDDRHLDSAARVLAEVLNARDPDRHWTVTVEEAEPEQEAA